MQTRTRAPRLGVVLAGGAGRRIGEPKGALKWQGRTLALRAAETLAALCSTVRISVAPGAASPAAGFEALPDAPPANRGPLSGIGAAFRAAPGHDLLVLACDYPRVDARLLRAIVAGAPAAAAVAFPVDLAGRDHPLVGLWRRTSAPAVERALGRGRLGVRVLLEELAVCRLAADELPGLDLERALVNVNTAADLAALTDGPAATD